MNPLSSARIRQGFRLISLVLLLTAGLGGCALFGGKSKAAPSPEQQALTQMAAPEPKKKSSWLSKIMFWKKNEPDAPKALAMNAVGRIFLFNAEQKYAVIESGSAAALVPGTPLIVVKDGSVLARLEVSPQSRPPFLAADLKFGKPQKNDLVYLDPQ